MSHRTMILKGEIVATQVIETADGEVCTHLVFRDDEGSADLITKLKSKGLVVFDDKNDDPDSIDAKYKIHEFAPDTWVSKPTIKAPLPNGLKEIE